MRIDSRETSGRRVRPLMRFGERDRSSAGPPRTSASSTRLRVAVRPERVQIRVLRRTLVLELELRIAEIVYLGRYTHFHV